MAYVDANISLNMISGMNFSGLRNGISLSGAPKWFEARYSDGSSDTFYGSGFTYNPFTHEPTGSGIVTAYSSNDYWNDMQIYVSGIRISASEIIKASWTKSIADDQMVIRAALAGNDTILGSNYADTLDGFDGNDTIKGFAGNDVIYGENGSDTLNGMTGNDTLTGGAGNDLLYGDYGADRLAGGTGYDFFVFNTTLSSANADIVTDFNPAYDTIRLENAVMPGLGTRAGTLSPASFWKSPTGLAHDANDRVIYETDTGWLNYDSNGSAAGGLARIAKLAPNLALTYADFQVI